MLFEKKDFLLFYFILLLFAWKYTFLDSCIFTILIFCAWKYKIIFAFWIHFLKQIIKKHKTQPPIWNTEIHTRVPKDVVILLLRELARIGDPVTARSVCRRSWFDDHVIKQYWYNKRAYVLFNKFTARYKKVFFIPTECHLYNNFPASQFGIYSQRFTWCKKNGIAHHRLGQEQVTVSFHLESSDVDSEAEYKLLGVFDDVIWIRKLN